MMTNAAKAKVWDAYVTPFGQAKVFTTATANVDIRLPRQWYQAEAAGSGLNQNHHRDYDPSLGRYIQVDPIGLAGGQNPYAYVDGMVYDYADPLGLEVRVVSSDPAFVKVAQEAYAKMNRYSPNARMMNGPLERSKKVIKIKYYPGVATYCPSYKVSNPECTGKYRTIVIDPCLIIKIHTTDGDQNADFLTTLSHELGHAYGELTKTPGEFDDGPNQMNNINAHENPIRRDMGYPERTDYLYSEPVVVTGKRR